MVDFKKGDWVRVIDNGGAPDEFTVGEVCRITDMHGGLMWSGQRAMFPRRFEPWAPRVGERVQMVRDGLSTTGAVGKAATVERINDGQEWPILLNIDGPVNYKTKAVSKQYTRCKADGLEPLVGPAAADKLIIQAGKFYKTRDGRKVGPIHDAKESFWGKKWKWMAPGISSPYADDGHWVEGGALHRNDIIAEWPAEATATPTTNIAATVDAQAEEYGPVGAAVGAEAVAAAPTKPKFRGGDRVRVVSNSRGGNFLDSEIGKEFTILTKDGPKNQDWAGAPEENVHWWPECDLSLVLTTPAIVCLIENGQPLPASRPYVHATTESATTEAKRMAGIHKGQEFGVFALTGERVKEVPAPVAKTYAHEWQRLAANGNKIPAIKELRSVSGIGLKAAKDAIEDWESRQPISVLLWGSA